MHYERLSDMNMPRYRRAYVYANGPSLRLLPPEVPKDWRACHIAVNSWNRSAELFPPRWQPDWWVTWDALCLRFIKEEWLSKRLFFGRLYTYGTFFPKNGMRDPFNVLSDVHLPLRIVNGRGDPWLLERRQNIPDFWKAPDSGIQAVLLAILIADEVYVSGFDYDVKEGESQHCYREPPRKKRTFLPGQRRLVVDWWGRLPKLGRLWNMTPNRNSEFCTWLPWKQPECGDDSHHALEAA